MYVPKKVSIFVAKSIKNQMENIPNSANSAPEAREEFFREMVKKGSVCQSLLAFGWQQEPTFDGYVEQYLW